MAIGFISYRGQRMNKFVMGALAIVCFPEIDSAVKVRHFCEEESIWDSEEKEWFYEKYETSKVEISSYLKVYVRMDRNELEMGQDPHVEIKDVDFQALQDSLDDNY